MRLLGVLVKIHDLALFIRYFSDPRVHQTDLKECGFMDGSSLVTLVCPPRGE